MVKILFDLHDFYNVNRSDLRWWTWSK